MTSGGHSHATPEEPRSCTYRYQARQHHDGGPYTPATEGEDNRLWLGPPCLTDRLGDRDSATMLQVSDYGRVPALNFITDKEVKNIKPK